MGAEVIVRLIGEFAVTANDRVVTTADFERSTGAELVQLLALAERQRLHRDQILDALWPNASVATGSNNLNKAASYARTALGDKTAIVSKTGVVSLYPERPLRIDYLDVINVDGDDDTAVDQVLAEHRGELLPDRLYAEWTMEARTRLQLTKLGLLRARGRWLDVVELDPIDEEANLELMAQAIERGQRDEVLWRFEQLEAGLRDELGVEPSAAARHLRDEALAIGTERAERALGAALGTPNALPRPVSSFIGRTAEIERAAALLRESRLVTLSGIGGVGKTRLSIEVAAALESNFPDGVGFVELASLTDPDSLADAIATGLGLPVDPAAPSGDRLLAHLAERRLLVLLDNCEHLVDDVAAFVDRLLRACPGVHVLATSRVGLGVVGEVNVAVRPLDVGPDGPAVELFAERAGLVRPGFAASAENLDLVARLCRRLDGIPLAIELASARLNVLSLDQIAERLDAPYDLLTHGERTAVDRQRSLRATMEWSFDLLSAADRELLPRLAVFADGFTIAAAEAVCDDITSITSAPSGLLDALGRLVEASLVVFSDEGRPRYRLLETVREYGLTKLQDTGTLDIARRRHGRYVLDLAAALSTRWLAGEGVDIGGFREELANHRTALTWAVEVGERQAALTMAVALRPAFWGEGMGRESLRWLTAAIDLAETDDDPLTNRAVAFALVDAQNMAETDAVRRLETQANAALRSSRDDVSRGLLSNALGAVNLDDLRRGDRLMGDAARYLRSAGDPMWRVALTNRMLTGWWMNAPAIFEEVLAAADLDDDRALASVPAPVLRVAAAVVADDAETILASVDTVETNTVWERSVLAYCRIYALRLLDRPDDAISVSVEDDPAAGVTLHHFVMHHQLALAHLQREDPDRAEAEFLPYRTETRVGQTIAALLAAGIAEQRGDDQNAALLAGFAQRVGRESGYRPHHIDEVLYDRSRAAVAERLGPSTVDRFTTLGATSEWADVVRLTRHETAPRSSSDRQPRGGVGYRHNDQ
ncbi:MAG: AAA family ATPase [Actinomycetota bacterium]